MTRSMISCRAVLVPLVAGACVAGLAETASAQAPGYPPVDPRSLRADNLGKTMGGTLLRLYVDVPEVGKTVTIEGVEPLLPEAPEVGQPPVDAVGRQRARGGGIHRDRGTGLDGASGWACRLVDRPNLAPSGCAPLSGTPTSSRDDAPPC